MVINSSDLSSAKANSRRKPPSIGHYNIGDCVGTHETYPGSTPLGTVSSGVHDVAKILLGRNLSDHAPIGDDRLAVCADLSAPGIESLGSALPSGAPSSDRGAK